MYSVKREIFIRESQLAQILAGEKTTVRRPVLPTQYLLPGDRLGVGEKHKGPAMEIDDIFALTVSGRPPILTPHKVKILSITREPVALITEQEARAEGWGGRNSFLLAWGTNNPLEITDCWVLTFELVDGQSE